MGASIISWRCPVCRACGSVDVVRVHLRPFNDMFLPTLRLTINDRLDELEQHHSCGKPLLVMIDYREVPKEATA